MEGRTMKYERPRFVTQSLDPASFAGQYCITNPTAATNMVAPSGLATRNGR